MGICKDKYVAFLNGLGYNVIRLPRTGVEPLQLLGRQNKAVTLLGGLDKLVEGSSKPLPSITAKLKATSINGKQTDALDTAVGVHLLGTFVGALGGKLGLKASYSRARSLTFSFGDVTIDRVLSLDVGEYLKNATLNSDNVVLKEYILGNGELYLITDVLRSSSITVSAEEESGNALELEVPDIQGVVGGDVKVSADSSSSHALSYQGQEALAFGFICVSVGVTSGKLSVVSLAPTEATSLSLATSDGDSHILLTSTGLLQLGA